MENRIITIVSTANSSKVEVETNATTLGELKAALRNAGVSYEGMTFYEGLTKTELIDDASLLPHDVIRNGEPTNNLVFMLTNTNKKIKSGADRTELYQIIKAKGLAEACKEKYGKNFTMCKTSDLEALVAEASKGSAKTAVAAKSAKTASKATEKKEACKPCKCEEAIRCLVDILYDNDDIDEDEKDEVLEKLGKIEREEKEDSLYKNDEIDDMFSFLK